MLLLPVKVVDRSREAEDSGFCCGNFGRPDRETALDQPCSEWGTVCSNRMVEEGGKTIWKPHRSQRSQPQMLNAPPCSQTGETE